MKKIVLATLVGVLALTGCASKTYEDKKLMTVEGQTLNVKIKNINSFEVEIAPRKAVCTVTDTMNNPVQAECLQYRRTIDRNFNNLSGNIDGFEYEEGFRYVLDVKQEAVLDKQTGQVNPVWSLNKVISKTAEISSAN